MSVYVVRIINRDLGYADENMYGTFRSRDKAQEWADKAEAILAQSPDAEDLFAVVDFIERPLLSSVLETYGDA